MLLKSQEEEKVVPRAWNLKSLKFHYGIYSISSVVFPFEWYGTSLFCTEQDRNGFLSDGMNKAALCSSAAPNFFCQLKGGENSWDLFLFCLSQTLSDWGLVQKYVGIFASLQLNGFYVPKEGFSWKSSSFLSLHLVWLSILVFQLCVGSLLLLKMARLSNEAAVN